MNVPEIVSDGKLLAKLSGGDAVAQEKYHRPCLVGLYNRKRAYLRNINQEQVDQGSRTKDIYSHWYFLRS